jgi:membrane protease YdiL (CAAX protease family)
MAVLAWIVAPWLGGRLGGEAPLTEALFICLTLGLIWQFALTMILVRREVGSLQWSRVRDALWLRSPRDPKTGRVGGKAWWWAALFVVLYGLVQLLPVIPGPAARDFGEFVASSGKSFFSGAWGWYGLVLVMFVFNTMLGEELLFRGLLLPRMQGAFGNRDYIANGVLFAVYHLHMPWIIPTSLLDTFFFARPSRRFESAWIGIIAHSAQSVFLGLILLALVLA